MLIWQWLFCLLSGSVGQIPVCRPSESPRLREWTIKSMPISGLHFSFIKWKGFLWAKGLAVLHKCNNAKNEWIL